LTRASDSRSFSVACRSTPDEPHTLALLCVCRERPKMRGPRRRSQETNKLAPPHNLPQAVGHYRIASKQRSGRAG
jgi:hypothetical protein